MKKYLITALIFMGFSITVFANGIVGEKIPNIVAKDQEGKEIKLQDLKGKWILLYFYPKDDTPGCTRQAQAFTEMHHAFGALGATVLGGHEMTLPIGLPMTAS